jgi:hypothetical protein
LVFIITSLKKVLYKKKVQSLLCVRLELLTISSVCLSVCVLKFIMFITQLFADVVSWYNFVCLSVCLCCDGYHHKCCYYLLTSVTISSVCLCSDVYHAKSCYFLLTCHGPTTSSVCLSVCVVTVITRNRVTIC